MIDNIPSYRIEIQRKYLQARNTDSDIYQHIPTLRLYAEECENITEFGVRYVCSSWAFLSSHPKRFTCYDINRHNEVDELENLAKHVSDFRFIQASTLEVEIESTDLLFIDTLHTYEQLSKELRLHGNKARKFIILHDTTTFGQTGEDGKSPGLWRAVEEFCATNNWTVKERFENNNGLTILSPA